ncbi:MAG: zinc ribbon domain-containing protein [Solirubrobacterales bacterium]
MALAIFGISNDGLNLVVNLLVLMLVVVWLALIVYTYLDAKRRISDPFLVGCATLASFIPYMGTAVYAIVRPPEFLEDAHERELEIKAAELRVRQLTEASCPGCEQPIERDYMRCPKCQRRLKDPCPSCGKPVDPRWSLCPYCEVALRERPRQRRSEEPRRKRSAGEKRAAKAPAREPRKETSKPQSPKGSPSREPDPDPRKA